MDVQQAVAEGAEIFADVEAQARAIKMRMRGLRKVFEAIRDTGAAGSLETQESACECDALATQFEADVWALHRKLTLSAQAKGIDLPATRDGGR